MLALVAIFALIQVPHVQGVPILNPVRQVTVWTVFTKPL